jgi:uncharacterized protein YndB with AHSA1/START domain
MSEIIFKKVYSQNIEKVWNAITDSEALAKWLMPNNFKLELNYQFQFTTKPQPFFDGIIQCEIIEINAPHVLVYTWQGGPMKKPTRVSWHLKEINEGTELILSHSGFEGISGYLLKVILGNGWKGLLNQTLLEFLKNGERHI